MAIKPHQEKIKYPEISPLWIGLFVDILGFYIVIPFLPTFINVFNTTPLIIGLILATNAFFTVIFAPIWGKISDKIGRKPILLISQGGTFTAFILLGFSNSIEMLFFARMIDGIFGGNFPMVKAIISDAIPPKDRGIQMTNVGVVHVLAGLVGPGLGGILSIIQVLGPSYPIATAAFTAAGLSLMSIFITILFVKETWSKEKRIQAHKLEKIKIKLWENKDASWLMTLYAFHTFGFIMYVSTLTIYIGIVLGLDTLGISILLTISGISRAIVRFTLFKPTKNLLGEKRMTEMGLIIVVITFFLIGFIYNIIAFTILMVIISYGISCSRGLLMSKVTQTVSPKEMGKINGYTTTLDSLAQISGPIIGTLILTATEPYWLGIVMGSLSFIAFCMIFKKITPYQEKIQIKKANAEHTIN
ncbi:MAG: MFS transporter [Promethearchaeota archaeon]